MKKTLILPLIFILFVSFNLRPIISQASSTSYLNSQQLKSTIDVVTSNINKLDTYANSVRNQHDSFTNNLSNLTITDLKESLNSHETKIQLNANFWNDTLKNRVISTNQLIIDYHQTFMGHYNTLNDLAKNNEREELLSFLNNYN
ncbi:HBL/NHE enterotoxin family protein [Bacillus carboniphilus]|uniref:HBL/NHE enterotoxin family protein n=1 Tax=Bacillus carboniphilus TaxID=86663 RepID=A0ABY9JS17_9BACI|nr:HBL/NHE enterotoxin family protein [Bacillus carboniphilus]WLR41162.1 HBL/NHE enterotoxin family protein [Bacillus carboniphilus]